MSYKSGMERLEKIKEYLSTNGAADVETLAVLFFPSLHRAQVVLANFANQKELSRKRYDKFIYFTSKNPANIKESARLNRTKTFFFRATPPNGWTLKESAGVLTLKNHWKNNEISILPLFTPDDRFRAKPGQKLITVGFDYQDFPRADTIKDVIKQL